jgi:hypothetical protein
MVTVLYYNTSIFINTLAAMTGFLHLLANYSTVRSIFSCQTTRYCTLYMNYRLFSPNVSQG